MKFPDLFKIKEILTDKESETIEHFKAKESISGKDTLEDLTQNESKDKDIGEIPIKKLKTNKGEAKIVKTEEV